MTSASPFTSPPERSGGTAPRFGSAPPSSPDGTPVLPEEGLTEQLLGIVRRRKWIVVQGFVIVLLVAAVLSWRQQEQYTASAGLLFVDPAQAVGGTFVDTDPAREAATNAALVALPEVARYASRRLAGRISAAEIAGSVDVEAGSGSSDLATIEAVSEDPQRAAEIANAYAEGYIDFRRDTDRDAIETSIEQLQRDIAALTPEQLAGAEGTELRRQVTALQASLALRTGGAKLVQPASAPTDPSSPNVALNLAAAAVVGLVLGLLVAALVDRLDRRVRSVDDLARLYGLPVLAEIPRNRRAAHGGLEPTTTDPETEPFRVLRMNLRYLGIRRDIRSLLIASPMRGDGKSTIARNLAAVMAAMGDRVVLVEADLHEQRAQVAERGLSTVLVGDDLSSALTEVSVGEHDDELRHLSVLPAGPRVPNSSELLESEAMRELLAVLEQHFELVIVDGPATASVSDSLALVPAVSGVLVVGGLGCTTSKGARDLRRQLALLNGNPIGVAVNFAPPPPSGYGYRS